VAVVAVKEYDDIWRARAGEPGQAGLAITASWFGDDSGAHACGNLRRPVCGVVVDNDDLGDEIGGKITYETADGLRLVARGNDH